MTPDPSALLMNITQDRCYSAAKYAMAMDGLGITPGGYHDTISKRGFMTAVRQ